MFKKFFCMLVLFSVIIASVSITTGAVGENVYRVEGEVTTAVYNGAIPEAFHFPNDPSVLNNADISGNSYLRIGRSNDDPSDGYSVTYTVNIEEAGTYSFEAVTSGTNSEWTSNYYVQIDGGDMVLSKFTAKELSVVHGSAVINKYEFPSVNLTAGTHTVTFMVNSRIAASGQTKFDFIIDYFELAKTGEYDPTYFKFQGEQCETSGFDAVMNRPSNAKTDGGAYFHVAGSADPSEGFSLTYTVDILESGTYSFIAACNDVAGNWASPYYIQIDDGAKISAASLLVSSLGNTTGGPGEGGVDGALYQKNQFRSLDLYAGRHTITFFFNQVRKLESPQYSFCIDYLELQKTPDILPTNSYKIQGEHGRLSGFDAEYIYTTNALADGGGFFRVEGTTLPTEDFSLSFDLNILESGIYSFEAPTSTLTTNYASAYYIQINDGPKVAANSIMIADKGGITGADSAFYQKYTFKDIELMAGKHTITFSFNAFRTAPGYDTSYIFCIDYLKLTWAAPVGATMKIQAEDASFSQGCAYNFINDPAVVALLDEPNKRFVRVQNVLTPGTQPPEGGFSVTFSFDIKQAGTYEFIPIVQNVLADTNWSSPYHVKIDDGPYAPSSSYVAGTILDIGNNSGIIKYQFTDLVFTTAGIHTITFMLDTPAPEQNPKDTYLFYIDSVELKLKEAPYELGFSDLSVSPNLDVSLNVRSFTTGSSSTTALIGLFDDNKLLDLALVPVTVSQNGVTPILLQNYFSPQSLPQDTSNCYIKAMLWDSTTGLMPQSYTVSSDIE